MTAQRSLLPKSMASAASSASAVPRMDAKTRSLVTAGFATLGAVAFLQNAGFVPRFAASSDGGGGEGAAARGASGGGRSLSIEPHEIEVTRVDDRTLQVAVNGQAEGYYAKFDSPPGPGVCVDSHNPPQGYDYARYHETTLADCAFRCAGQLLLNEHRGFNYDATSGDCCCLYDDQRIPLTEKRKSSTGQGLGYNVDLNGDGSVAGTSTGADGELASYECYVKAASVLGSPLDSYDQDTTSCGTDDGESYDVVSFGPVFSPESCAEKCLRFKLFATHARFEHQTDRCDCLFQDGEAPQARKLSGSGAVESRGQSFGDRNFAASEQLKCYDKKALQNAPVENLVPLDTSNRVWINEFHYRNLGLNQPFVEVIGPKGADASGYAVVMYQGRNGAVHKTIQLGGNFVSLDPLSEWGYVTVNLLGPDIRKGKQGGDGLALVRTADGTCLQLLSYTDAGGVDRSFGATEGACAGKSSTPIGLFEERSTPLGHSIQLVDKDAGVGGNNLGAFTWSGPGPSTKGGKNVGQTLTSP